MEFVSEVTLTIRPTLSSENLNLKKRIFLNKTTSYESHKIYDRWKAADQRKLFSFKIFNKNFERKIS
jgi:hypothetical protein